MTQISSHRRAEKLSKTIKKSLPKVNGKLVLDVTTRIRTNTGTYEGGDVLRMLIGSHSISVDTRLNFEPFGSIIMPKEISAELIPDCEAAVKWFPKRVDEDGKVVTSELELGVLGKYGDALYSSNEK